MGIINNQIIYYKDVMFQFEETFKIHMHSHNLSAHPWY